MKPNDQLEPTIFVIGGGAGDLTRRQKFLAPWHGEKRRMGEFARHLHYQQGDFKRRHTYTTRGERCTKLE
ncbi:MAG: hypothetical protein ABI604_20390 [Nitrospirota bacterium]